MISIKNRERLSHYFHKFKFRWATLPPEIYVEPTNHCNLRCSICMHKDGITRDKGFMDFTLFEKIVSQAKGKIPKMSLFLGGEATLHPRLADMIVLAKKNGFYLRLHTNGALVKSRSWDTIAKLVDDLHFSFDGPTKERHEKIRTGSKFEDTVSNIKSVIQKRPSHLTTTIESVTLNEDNCSIEKELQDMFPSANIRIISQHNWPNLFVDKRENTTSCSLLYNRICVGWDGKVVTCCNDLNGEGIMGDINKNTIEDIWNGPDFVLIRVLHMMGRAWENPICSKCDNIKRKNETKGD